MLNRFELEQSLFPFFFLIFKKKLQSLNFDEKIDESKPDFLDVPIVVAPEWNNHQNPRIVNHPSVSESLDQSFDQLSVVDDRELHCQNRNHLDNYLAF